MRLMLLGAAAALGLCPMVASAVVVVRADNVVGNPGELIPIEIFASPSDATNERLEAFTIAVEAPSFAAANAPKFVIPAPRRRTGAGPEDPILQVFDRTTNKGYVFGPTGEEPIDPAGFSDEDTVLLSATNASPVDIDDPIRSGFARLMVQIPANAQIGQVFPITIDPTFLSLAGPALITAVPGLGSITVVPEPASMGLIVLGGLLTLRRRRVA